MKKVAEHYPITTVQYPDGNKKVYISYDHIKEYTAPVQLKSLEEFMTGQTCFMEGYFPDDIQRWLNGLPVID